MCRKGGFLHSGRISLHRDGAHELPKLYLRRPLAAFRNAVSSVVPRSQERGTFCSSRSSGRITVRVIPHQT